MAQLAPSGDGRTALVAGGGIGGMAMAILLRQQGWAVDLVEADPDWRVYGAGISITAPTFRAFQHLGLLDEIQEFGFCSRADGRLCGPDGRTMTELPMPPFAPGMPHAGGIMRPILHKLLSRRVRESGTQIRLGVTLDGLDDVGDGVDTRTSDDRRRRYDLLVGADGMFSSVRRRLFPDAPVPRYTGQYCWRLAAPRAAEIDRPHFYMAGAVTAGLMPVSEGGMYLWLLETNAQKVRLDPATQHLRLAELMAPFGGAMGDLRDSLTAGAPIVSRPLEALLLPRPWHKGRAVLIGDAAHATTPHLASGAGLAVEDAVVLAQSLAAETQVERAFQTYMDRRWERCRMVVENSIGIGEMQQTNASPERLNALMGQSHKALLAAY